MLRISNLIALAALVGTVAATAGPAYAMEGEATYVFNTLSFMIHGFLVMFMAAGFAMLESGLTRTKNVATICTKNIALYGLACVMYYIVGYNLMYDGVDGGFLGSFSMWSADNSGAEGGDFAAVGYSAESDWFFQAVFVATTASIVSGTVAERIKFWPFMLFTAFLTAIVYPIQGSWQWGGGWLSEMGFSDFAGSTIVHSAGGWAALAGAIVLGARKGKFGKDGSVHPMPGSNLPLATLGTFILWLGWFGFNGGSQLALGSAADAIAISKIYINTNIAACGGLLAAMVLTQIIYKKIDLTMVLNGALAGLVSITAAPDTPTMASAFLIGGVGGILVVFAVPMLDKLKIDDVVGAVSVHLVCGIWGTLAVPITNGDATFTNQLVGVAAIGAFVFISSLVFWFLLKVTVGIRVSEEAEVDGLDKHELGLEAYPEFGHGSQKL